MQHTHMKNKKYTQRHRGILFYSFWKLFITTWKPFYFATSLTKKWEKQAKQRRSAANFFCLCMWQARCNDPTRGHLRELGANASSSIFSCSNIGSFMDLCTHCSAGEKCMQNAVRGLSAVACRSCGIGLSSVALRSNLMLKKYCDRQLNASGPSRSRDKVRRWQCSWSLLMTGGRVATVNTTVSKH